MENFKPEALKEALKQITSLLHKLEAIDITKQKAPQMTLILRRIEAMKIARTLIEDKLKMVDLINQ